MDGVLSLTNGRGRTERVVERGDVADLEEVAHPVAPYERVAIDAVRVPPRLKLGERQRAALGDLRSGRGRRRAGGYGVRSGAEWRILRK